MTSKNKKNLGNKVVTSIPVAAPAENSAQVASSAVVVDIRSRRNATDQSISPAAEGLRLVQAFLKIPDPIRRAELIQMAEDYVRRAQRSKCQQ